MLVSHVGSTFAHVHYKMQAVGIVCRNDVIMTMLLIEQHRPLLITILIAPSIAPEISLQLHLQSLFIDTECSIRNKL